MEGEFEAQIFCPHFGNRKLCNSDSSRLFVSEGIQIEALLPVLIQIRAIKILFFRLSVVFYLWYLYSSFFASTEDDLRSLFS